MSRDPQSDATTFRSLLEAEAERSELPLAAECLDRLTTHYELLCRWNKAVRLTGNLDPHVVGCEVVGEVLALAVLQLRPGHDVGVPCAARPAQ